MGATALLTIKIQGKFGAFEKGIKLAT